MQDFSKCKAGDRLWSIQLGECEVYERKDGIIFCKGKCNYNKAAYNYEGKYYPKDKLPSLFFSKPEIKMPESQEQEQSAL